MDAENSIFGTDHTFIGSEMAKKWGFPKALCDCIKHHHTPKGYIGDNEKTKIFIHVFISVIHLFMVAGNNFLISFQNDILLKKTFLQDAEILIF